MEEYSKESLADELSLEIFNEATDFTRIENVKVGMANNQKLLKLQPIKLWQDLRKLKNLNIKVMKGICRHFIK